MNGTMTKMYATSSGMPSVEVPKDNPVSDILVDSFGRIHSYLRISLTERCNLRCQYCMLQKFWCNQDSSNWWRTIRKDIDEVCLQLSNLPGLKTLAMTTNGITLANKLPRLKECGLSLLNISLDTLVPASLNS
ncbi:UNVERIFIED_CONTAM: GTP 3',8-cyclase, mitochondrial [Sesamum latifolium]|uniref:GTP 3',8-cyclase, mitochondrial n=1 Tax=Sesamum latifolium TaxID=2727402 RepID=A0AAW2U646_9LAMI